MTNREKLNNDLLKARLKKGLALVASLISLLVAGYFANEEKTIERELLKLDSGKFDEMILE